MRAAPTALLAALLLSACSLQPPDRRPAPAVPASWPVGDAYLRQSEATLPSVTYPEIFRDPKLQAIIARALANNQDVRIALANIASARALYRVQRAELLPRVEAGAGITTGDRGNGSTAGTGTGTGIGTGAGAGGGTDPGAGSGTGAGTGTGPVTGGGGVVTTGGGGRSTSYSVDLGVTSFEIDLFGRLRSLSNAALQEYLGTEVGARATRLALVADVAEAYLTLATDRSLLAIALDTERSAQRSVDLTRARLRGGVAPRSDLRQAENILQQAQSDRADLITIVAQDRNALELLVGAPVADTELPASIETVDTMVAELPAGLDSRVLLRRPDVVQAEYVLRAANARIGAARAAFFPTISLTAIAGFASTALSSLFSGGAFNWSVSPNASLPIFDGGANRGNLAYQVAQRDVAVAQYQQTVQTAFRETADALARRGTIARQFAAQEALVASAQDNYVLAEARYREGIDTFLASLDAQRTLYSARRSLATTRLVRANSLVALYRALGGDMLVAQLPETAPEEATAGAG